jgi:hypothetical protein
MFLGFEWPKGYQSIVIDYHLIFRATVCLYVCAQYQINIQRDVITIETQS